MLVSISPRLYHSLALLSSFFPYEYLHGTFYDRGLKSLFPNGHNPFYACFGTNPCDMIAFSRCGVPEGRIYIVSPETGEVRGMNRTFRSSYEQVNALIHEMFPAVSGKILFYSMLLFTRNITLIHCVNLCIFEPICFERYCTACLLFNVPPVFRFFSPPPIQYFFLFFKWMKCPILLYPKLLSSLLSDCQTRSPRSSSFMSPFSPITSPISASASASASVFASSTSFSLPPSLSGKDASNNASCLSSKSSAESICSQADDNYSDFNFWKIPHVTINN